MATRWRASALAVATALLLAAPVPTHAALPARVLPGGFHVSGNRIVDSEGDRFIVKGADAVNGRFAGGDANGWGLRNYFNAERDLSNLKHQGVNTIRISVGYLNFVSGPVGSTEYLTELDQVVSWVTGRGMVAELSQGGAGFSTDVVTFVGMLAGRYAGNRLVWIKPDNEPSCTSGDPTYCGDWAYWQSTERQFVRAIREAGNKQPIVVNCVWWSFECDQIVSHPLGDSNIIYGAHRYGNGTLIFDSVQAADCDAVWANLAGTYPIIVEEVGLYSGVVSPTAWGAGFLDYATRWVQTRQGSGVIGFTDSWSDANSMTNSVDGSWNDWGQTFIDHYWSVVRPGKDDDRSN